MCIRLLEVNKYSNCHDNVICFKYQVIFSLSTFLIFMIRSTNTCFVWGLIIHTDSKTVGLGDTFVTFCIVSLKALGLNSFFFSPLMSPELIMIVMCHNVILVLI